MKNSYHQILEDVIEGGLFREDYYASWYYCHSCGYKWEIKNN